MTLAERKQRKSKSSTNIKFYIISLNDINQMGAAFHSGHKEEDWDLHKCPMCNTLFFRSKTSICPTCGMEVKNLPVQTPPTTPVQATPNQTVGIILAVFGILVATGTIYFVFSDFSFFESGIPAIEEILVTPPDLKDEFKIGNSLSSFYDKVRKVNTPFGSNKDRVKFAARLALHDMHQLRFTTVQNEYLALTGEESSDQAFEYLDKAYRYCMINSNDDDTECIKKILKFVTDNVVYELELDDLQRSPIETLSLGSGDCDDFSVLAGALFEGAYIESALGFCKNDDGVAHLMVLVHLPKLKGTTSWGFDDLTARGLEPGRWILLAPQYTLEYQNDEEWMSQWHLVEAVELDFEKAHS